MKKLLLKRRLFFLLFIVLFHANTSFSQNCLKTSDSVTVRGFRLGMTEAEAKKRYPKIELNKDLDVAGITKWRNSSAGSIDDIFTEAERENLESIEIIFFDKKLSQIKVIYNGFIEWKSLTEFTDASAKSLNLPISANWLSINDSYSSKLQCKDFYVISRLDPIENEYELQKPSLFFSLTDYEKKLDERKKTQSEDQKKAFNP